MTPPAPTPTAPTPDPRVGLLRDSYREVLDATKHQDDKVGRLLTATAFLTAASLALANLAGGKALLTTFTVQGQDLPPLALIALAVFLVSIVFGATMLVYSVATPLAIPGFSATGGTPRGRQFSQLYFLDISRASRGEWEQKWKEENADGLQDELAGMYVKETHNLAIRADFKYARTNEAIAALTLGLLALSVAVILVCNAILGPCGGPDGATCGQSVDLSSPFRLALGVIVGGWTFATLGTQLRSTRLRVEDLVGVTDWRMGVDWFRAWSGRIFATTAALASGVLVAVPPQDGSSVRYVLLILSIVFFYLPYLAPLWPLIRRTPTTTTGDEEADGKAGEETGVHYREWTSAVINGVGLVAALALTLRADATMSYGYAMLAGFAIPVAIAIRSLVGPTAESAERRSKYRRSLPKPAKSRRQNKKPRDDHGRPGRYERPAPHGSPEGVTDG